MANFKKNISKPLVLGIHWAHDASVALCSPEGVICNIQEERLRGIKHYYGFPTRSVRKIFKYCGLSAKDISIVAFSTHAVLFPNHLNYSRVEADGSVESGDEMRNFSEDLKARLKKFIHSNLGMSFLKNGRKLTELQKKVKSTWGSLAHRHYCFQGDFLKNVGLWNEKIRYYYIAHHRSHASSVFRLSGKSKACIITVDGKGDGLSATIYRGDRDGRMDLLRCSKASDSLGAFYQAVTEVLGFIPVEGEYKTMGLAALGSGRKSRNPFKSIISVKNGVFYSSILWRYRDFNKIYPQKAVPNMLSSVSQADEFKKLLKKFSREKLAFYAQRHCEENMLQYARDAMRITRVNNLLGAGGVLLNVKANALIRDTLKPACFFVYPDSSDGGLAVGAAMEAMYQDGFLTHSVRLTTPYTGHDFSNIYIKRQIEKFQKKYRLKLYLYSFKMLVDKLLQGKVIGTFQGRMETGPRALGNRSVLADARDAKVKDRINLKLKGRDYFVPFAPALLKEDAHLYWQGEADYKYMTFTVKATSYAERQVPAVVHVDGTMRPQVVTRTSNSWFYRLLKEFKKATGIGLLLNTSFNRHGYPIVGSPRDALFHLKNKWVDGLVLGKWYIELKECSSC